MYKIFTMALLGATSGMKIKSVFLPLAINEDGNLVSIEANNDVVNEDAASPAA